MRTTAVDEERLEPLPAYLAALARRGSLVYRAMPREEQAWRGRYLLMAACLGASPVLAWAAALTPTGVEAEEMQRLVATTPDERIAWELRTTDVSVEDFLPYE